MLLFLWRSSWLIISGVLIAGLISGLSNAVLIAMINQTITGHPDEQVYWWFAALVMLLLTAGFASHFWLMKFSTRLASNLRINLARLILNTPYSKLQNFGSSALRAHLTEDINAIANASELFPILCVNSAIVFGCMGYLSWLSWHLALALGGVILFGVLTYQHFKVWPARSLKRARDEYEVLNFGFTALTEGIRELKLHRLRSDAFIEESLAASSESYRHHSLRAGIGYLWVNQWVQFLYYSTVAGILFGFPLWQPVTLEVKSGYILAFLFMMSPLTVLTGCLPVFAKAKVALNKIQQINSQLVNRTTAKPIRQVNPENAFINLKLQGVTHSFHSEKDNRRFTLGPIDLEFKPGELVFLVGGNGSGKTTLAMLLLGLYSPEQGRIVFNDELVTDANRDFYMQNFSVIFSDFYLFEALYGLDFAENRNLIEEYLQRLHLNHKVELKDGRFSTTKLSQGQRKRLALLVSYLENKPFYVFDEWAADQDPEFKQLFYTELLPSLKAQGKTVLVISHDDKYFYLADRCIKLEEGLILADGPVPEHRQAPAKLVTPPVFSSAQAPC